MTAQPLIAGSPPTPQARGDRGRWCENALLRRAMKQARAGRDEATAAALVDALAGADLIVPARRMGQEPRVLVIERPLRPPTYMAFTDEGKLAAFARGHPEWRCFTVPGTTVALEVLEHKRARLVLDPNTPMTRVDVDRDALQRVGEREVTVHDTAGDAVDLRILALSCPAPPAVLDAVAALAADDPTLVSVAVFEGSRGVGHRTLAAGLILAEDGNTDAAAVATAVADRLTPHAPPDDPLEVYLLPPAAAEIARTAGALTFT